jgi:hypothetical protein
MKKQEVSVFNRLVRPFGCVATAFIFFFAGWHSAAADGIGFNPATMPGQIPVAGLRAPSSPQYTYVYVKEGESLSYLFERAGGSSSGNYIAYSFYSPLGQVGTTETIYGTDGVARTGSITATAETAGIWTIEMTVAGTLNTWRYDFNAVSDASDPVGSRIAGRVYMEILNITQNSAGANINIPLYLHTPSGHKYNVLFSGYNGVTSRIASDQLGIVSQANCGMSLYRSAEGTDTSIRNVNLPTCGVQNKLFYSASDPSMPASASRWDFASGQPTSEWLNPPLSGPLVTELAYTSSGAVNSLAGDFTLKISDHIGTATLQLDLDNDGVYGGVNDRSIPFLVANENTLTVPFDGLDANGSPISGASTIKAKVLVDKTGEVHFTLVDVENLGGVKITRITGDPTNATILYWDDTLLTETGKTSVTSLKDGTGGVNSDVTNGVHGWGGSGNAQWGNDRLIDNWTYASAAATQEITVENCAANAGTLSR